MLGFMPSAPIGARREFTSVTASLAATVSISLSLTAAMGPIASMSATVNLGISPTALISPIQGMLATVPINISLSPKVTVAGKPIIVTALSEDFSSRAMLDSFEFKAPADSFTTRGWQ